MNDRPARLAEMFETIGDPLARLGHSLGNDKAAVLKSEQEKTDGDFTATDAFLQRFQQVADLSLRKLFPHILAVLDSSDQRLPFGAVLDRLDGFEVLSDVPWWIELNEIRNRLVHEYAMNDEQRVTELTLAWQAASRLQSEIVRIKHDRTLGRRLFPHG